MATLQELIVDIADDATRQAQQIDSQTQEQLARYESETDRMLAAERERRFVVANKQREELLARMKAKQQLEMMQSTLRTKQDLIDQAFEQARHELGKQSNARSELLARLWRRANTQIAVSSVIVASKDARMFQGKGLQVRTVEGLGGRAWATRNDDGGATFAFTLPSRRAADVAPEAAQETLATTQ